MLYAFAKFLMTTGLRFFYRHLYVTGFENVPAKGPVIIIANHNSSLMDAALLGILLKRQAWFFTRGDVFVNRFVKKLLSWLHMMPVHSYTGGRQTLGANNQSFSAGQQILMNGGIIVFFPESTSHIEHQLLPFRKGVFRIAFDTAAAAGFSFDIPVVPVGITYEHPVACRTTVNVHAGNPLWLKNYEVSYKLNAAAAVLQLCRDAHDATSTLVLHLKDAKRLSTAAHCLTVCRNDHSPASRQWIIPVTDDLQRLQNICNATNASSQEKFEEKQKVASEYGHQLAVHGLTDKAICPQFLFPSRKRYLLIAGFPLYVLGLLLNGAPVLLARQVVDKKVYRKDFYSWIFVVCYSFGYLFWLIALLIVAGLYFGWALMLVTAAVVIASGLFAYFYKDWQAAGRWQRRKERLPASAFAELQQLRSSLYFS